MSTEANQSEEMKKVDETISDEVLRSRIRRLVAEGKKSPAARFFRHPLFVAAFSFLLTGLIGFALTNRVQEKETAHEKEKEREAALIKSLEDVSKLMFGRQTRASLLYSALNRPAALKELQTRKTDYDEAYYDWNANRRAVTFILRQANNSSVFSEFEKNINLYVIPLFRDTDACLTRAFDTASRGRKVQPELDRCLRTTSSDSNTRENDISRQTDCFYAVTERVYTFIVAGNEGLSGPDADVGKRCGDMAAKSHSISAIDLTGLELKDYSEHAPILDSPPK